jgi:hypothetical protein
MCCQSWISDAWVTNQAGGLGKSGGRERACFAGKSLHKISVLKYIYFFKTFYKVMLLIYIVTCLRSFAIRFVIVAAFIVLLSSSVIHLVSLGSSCFSLFVVDKLLRWPCLLLLPRPACCSRAFAPCSAKSLTTSPP